MRQTTNRRRGPASTVQDAERAVFGYVRVSTDKQDLSPDVQAKRIAAWAEMKGLSVTKVFCETQSGKSADDRAVLQEVLKAVCEAGGVLVIAKLDRLARNVKDACGIVERLNEAGADLASLSEGDIDTTTSNGKLIFTIFSALAEFERDQISERTLAVLDAKRTRGEALGNTPFGESRGKDGKLVENEAEERAKAFCLEKWVQFRSLAYCVRAMNDAGHRSRQMPWDAGSVGRVLGVKRAKGEAVALRAAVEAAVLDLGLSGDLTKPDRKKDRQKVAARLRELGVAPPKSRWSCGQVARMVREYLPADVEIFESRLVESGDAQTLR